MEITTGELTCAEVEFQRDFFKEDSISFNIFNIVFMPQIY